MIRAHLPAAWLDRVHVFERISWDEVWSLAGKGPGAFGLHGAYHWLNFAQQRADGDLAAPNPAPKYPADAPIGDILSRAEFDRYGPVSAVWVNAAPIAEPEPPTVTLASVRAELVEYEAHLATAFDALQAEIAEIRASIPE